MREERKNDALTADLEAAQLELAQLTSIGEMPVSQENDTFPESPPLEHDDATKLAHIRSLHAAITSLGPRCPRDHTQDTWDELHSELKHMLNLVASTNTQLEELGHPARQVSGISSPGKTGHHRQNSGSQNSEPRSFHRSSSSTSAIPPRLPSPTDSNVSARRDPPSHAGKATKAKNRNSAPPKTRSIFSGQSSH